LDFSGSIGSVSKKSSLVGGSSVSGSGRFSGRGGERWGWAVAVSTISISNSAVWDGHGLSELTTDIENNSVVGDITDSLLVGKGKRDLFTSVILSSHVDSLGGSEEPAFDSLTVEISGIGGLRGSSESTGGLLSGSGNGDIAPLGLFPGVLTSGEFTVSSDNISSRSKSFTTESDRLEVDPGVTHTWALTFNNSSSRLRFVSNHSEFHGGSSGLSTSFDGSNGHGSGSKSEDGLISTIEDINELFTSDGSGTLESEDTSGGTDLDSGDFTSVGGNTDRVVSLFLVSSDGGLKRNLDIGEWKSVSRDNNWD
jgi:hypothetical protein